MSDGLPELMSQYLAGDSAAFAELYGRVASPILAYLTRMCGTRDVAEDLLQETLLKVHRARSSYTDGANPMPWLYAIAHRTFLDHARKRKRARVKPASDPERMPVEPAHITGKRQADVVPRDPEAIARLQRALELLSTSQRQAVVLTKLEGKSLAEAAEIAGTSVGAMKLRVHRAVGKLRSVLVETSNE